MKKNKLHLFPILLILAALVLSSCNLGAAPTPSPEEIAQQVAATQAAVATQNSVNTLVALVTQIASNPTATPQPPCPVCQVCPACPTPIPSTANPSANTLGTAVAPTVAPVQAGTQCIQYEFLGDVGIKPGTILKAGEKFTAAWKIKNIGTCSWTSSWDLVFIGGDVINNTTVIDFPASDPIINPGDIITISGDFLAPLSKGNYYSYWMITPEDHSSRFGYGPNGQWGLGIFITVE